MLCESQFKVAARQHSWGLFTAGNRKQIRDAKEGLHDPGVALAIGAGRSGDALQFITKKRMLTFYKAAGNTVYSQTNFTGAISFWLKVDPVKDLAPGYCDPIQITDSKYNDAAIWVDFTKDNPRNFRLGVVGDLESWNPKKSKKNGGISKRTLKIKELPFSGNRWTHVLINFQGLNSDDAQSSLFLDGNLIGTLEITDPFTWSIDQSNIMIGLNYVGLMDELSIFDRPLTKAEIKTIAGDNSGMVELLKVPQPPKDGAK